MSRIYLDNAATSWPKPESVYTAVEQTQRHIGVSSSRGSHESSAAANQIIKRTRQQIATLINASAATDIALTTSGTDALSTAILGTLRLGDHAITSAADHNSVIRPLIYLRDAGTIDLTIVDCNQQGLVSTAAIEQAITPETRLVALTHASNVLGTIEPIAEVGNLCRTNGISFLVDAAQTIGHLPIDVQTLGCDMLAAPGHKGLHGPLGTGFLYVTPSTAANLRPLRFGGTGSQHADQGQPTTMPAMLEAGSLNVPAIAGLLAGAEFVMSDEGQSRIAQSDVLYRKLVDGLHQISGITIYGAQPNPQSSTVPVVAFLIAGYDSQTVSGILDSSFQIQTRAGLHCAPYLHQQINTADAGLVRLSIGLFNSADEIETALAALTEIANA